MLLRKKFFRPRISAVLFTASLSLLYIHPNLEAKTVDGSSFQVDPSSSYKEIYDMYEQLKKGNQPQLITTDLVLHTVHLLINRQFRLMEIEFFYPKIKELASAMALSADKLQETLTGKELREAIKGVTGYFSVGACLFDPGFSVPAAVKQDVEAELESIDRHSGFGISRIIPYAEDFSQYVPRGHYTRNHYFAQYFKAMMWFGRRQFRVEERSPGGVPGEDSWTDAMMLREARQMLLLTYLLETTRVGDKTALESYNEINDALVLFTGDTEDLEVRKVQGAAKAVWNKMPSPVELMDTAKVRKFILLAREATHPRIDSSGTERKGFCLFGQRFSPDGYVMQSLVSKRGSLKYTGKEKSMPFTCGNIVGYGLARAFPRGMDIFAVLGSEKALQMLADWGDTSYEGYDKKIAELRNELPRMIENGKDKNFYYGLLHALMGLIEPPRGKNLPGVFSAPGWSLKQLNTCLGSWTELRHDNILYVKQSYTAVGSAFIKPTFPPGYVEPYPEFYRRIRGVVQAVYKKARNVLASAKQVESNFQDFDNLMQRLEEISTKELQGIESSREDLRDISEFALQFKYTAQFPNRIMEKIGEVGESQMALVADVHTDNNSQMVLEEGIGMPFLVELKIPGPGETLVFKGGIYSYYEFKQPMSDRLTDEKWISGAKDQQRPLYLGIFTSR